MDPGRGSHQRGDDGAGDTRQVVDFHTSVINSIHERVYYGGRRQPNMGVRPLQPHRTYTRYMLAPFSTTFNPATACTTRYVKTCQNNHPYVVNKVVWNPGARMLLTGSAKGEFTLWRLPDFSYERLIQHHTQAVRGLSWSHSGQWLISSDDLGKVKYFEHTLNPVAEIAAHKERVNDVSFAPTDRMFATAAADHTVAIWDFETKQQVRVCVGHGFDVCRAQWHPHKSLVVSCSRDNSAILWDPRADGKGLLHTLQDHTRDVKLQGHGQRARPARDHGLGDCGVRAGPRGGAAPGDDVRGSPWACAAHRALAAAAAGEVRDPRGLGCPARRDRRPPPILAWLVSLHVEHRGCRRRIQGLSTHPLAREVQ